MSQRIHLNPNAPRAPMMQGYQPDPIGRRSPAPTSNNEMFSQVQQISSKAEDIIDAWTQPVRPYVPAIARFLIVVTFIEDALRIIMQWSDQLWYLHKYRHMPRGISHLFLLFNILAMSAGSVGVIGKRYTEISIGLLLSVVAAQGLGYGLLFDLSFFLRNLSVVGGLIMVFSDSLQKNKKLFAGLPSLSETDKRKYFQLAGRVLLIFLFIGFIFQGKWSFGRVLVSIIGFCACIMVVVGFKAKWSAMFLVALLSVFNVFTNAYWKQHVSSPSRDFAKYDFFQTLSIVGGLLLLTQTGAGTISLDEKKKVY